MLKRDWFYTLLLIVFVTSIVIANAVGARVVTTGLTICGIELATSGGALTYAFTFLCTDVIGELWGKDAAMKVVKWGFVGQLYALAMILATGMLTASDAGMDAAYRTLFGQNWCFVAGSLAAYYVSQTWDVWIFHKLRDWYRERYIFGMYYGNRVEACYQGQGRWIWNNVSTMTSQIWDTLIYCAISFGLGMGWFWKPEMWKPLLGICVGQYLLKFALAALDTPIFYALTKREE